MVAKTYTGYKQAKASWVDPWTGKRVMPDKLYHYTNSANANSIDANGLRRSTDGNTYTTPEGNYNSQQAIESLNLNPAGGDRDVLYQINVNALINDGIVPSFPSPVVGGTGYKVLFNQPIPAKYLMRIK